MNTLNLPEEVYQSSYKQLLRIRMVEEKIAELYPEQEMMCRTSISQGHFNLSWSAKERK